MRATQASPLPKRSNAITLALIVIGTVDCLRARRQLKIGVRMALQIDHLRKTYVGPDGSQVPVIDIDSFTLFDAEQVSLIGTSGSGKTTLLHMIAGILTPDSGRILFDSEDITKLGEAERDVFRGSHVGYIFQTHHLLGGFTALENVLLGMSFTGRPADRGWARHLLEEVGLSDRLNYRPAKLSVGQQQ